MDCSRGGLWRLTSVPGGWKEFKCRVISAYLQCKALGDFERVFLGAPFALEDGIAQDFQGVRAAQATKVDKGHRCSDAFFQIATIKRLQIVKIAPKILLRVSCACY